VTDKKMREKSRESTERLKKNENTDEKHIKGKKYKRKIKKSKSVMPGA